MYSVGSRNSSHRGAGPVRMTGAAWRGTAEDGGRHPPSAHDTTLVGVTLTIVRRSGQSLT